MRISEFRDFLGRLLLPRIQSVMSRPVLTISRDAFITEAVKLMLTHEVGSLVVTSNNEPVGIFTRRDLMNRVLAGKLSLDQSRIEDVMSSPIVSARPSDDLAKAMEAMRSNDVTRLVVHKNGELIGILTTTDIRLRFPRGYFSYSLALKRFLVDTIAYLTFWSGISAFIQIFIIRLTWTQFIAGSIIGFILTILLGGFFGRYLDLWRRNFEV